MRVLRQAGIAEATARSAYGAVHTYTLGFAALKASRARQGSGSEDVSDLARQLAAYTTTGQFTEGLRYLLEGISGHADTRQGTGRTTSRALRRDGAAPGPRPGDGRARVRTGRDDLPRPATAPISVAGIRVECFESATVAASPEWLRAFTR